VLPTPLRSVQAGGTLQELHSVFILQRGEYYLSLLRVAVVGEFTFFVPRKVTSYFSKILHPQDEKTVIYPRLGKIIETAAIRLEEGSK
jgi:hypothetical protein